MQPAEPSSVILEAQGVTKTYRFGDVEVHAVQGIDLQAQRGAMLAIMGPSGSGKSSLLYILGGLEVPTSGRVLLEGTDLAALNDDQRTVLRRQRIGFIFQNFNLLPTLTAEENVMLPLKLDGLPAAAARQRAAEMLDVVGMEPRRQQYPSSLSGGEQQRIAIARALIIRPALLLADEPTGNLDSENSQKVTAVLRRLVDQLRQTIIMVTHDQEVASHADRLLRLRDGRIEHDHPTPMGGRESAARGDPGRR